MPFDGTAFRPAQVLSDLLKARALIEEKGWQRSAPRDNDDDPYCPLAAVWDAQGITIWKSFFSPRFTRANRALQKAIPSNERERLFSMLNYFTVPFWNTRLGRTKEDVIALFDRAIAAQLEL